jgi:hypothetical protein
MVHVHFSSFARKTVVGEHRVPGQGYHINSGLYWKGKTSGRAGYWAVFRRVTVTTRHLEAIPGVLGWEGQAYSVSRLPEHGALWFDYENGNDDESMVLGVKKHRLIPRAEQYKNGNRAELKSCVTRSNCRGRAMPLVSGMRRCIKCPEARQFHQDRIGLPRT